MTTFQTKKETLQSDIQELEKFLIHEYLEMAKSINVQKVNLCGKYQALLTEISKHRDDWYNEIDTITQSEKTKVDVMRTKCMHALDKQEGEIKNHISQIRQNMSFLKSDKTCRISRNYWTLMMSTWSALTNRGIKNLEGCLLKSL